MGAIGAVFSSWMTARAVTYRRLHGIPESWGTAVNVQAMVLVTWEKIRQQVLLLHVIHRQGKKNFMVNFLVNAQGRMLWRVFERLKILQRMRVLLLVQITRL